MTEREILDLQVVFEHAQVNGDLLIVTYSHEGRDYLRICKYIIFTQLKNDANCLSICFMHKKRDKRYIKLELKVGNSTYTNIKIWKIDPKEGEYQIYPSI